MAKFRLAFGLHNHQPIGNFEHVFERAQQKAYHPFLHLLQQHPNIRISFHQSGILWRWQEKNHPEFLESVSTMAKSGQLELMTGGFYEPILTSIPERDVLGQITMLNRYLAARFDIVPEGLWLTERIWEPHLPRVLAQAKVKYLPIDDTHFIYAGLEQEELKGPFVTEHEGFQMVLLPIQKKLRYLIPFGTVEQVIAELRRQAEKSPCGLAIYADDGEKFGEWPKTHEHCYKNKWLEQLFQAIEQQSDWLEIVPLREAARAEPVGRVYLPSASYAELLHWSLPPEAFVEYEHFERWLKEQNQWTRFGRFVRGGHWRGFLSKYDEANLMHKKMLSVSKKLEDYERNNAKRNPEAEIAREMLYAGQCNCPYWHGVFGGLYLPHIRQAVYANLIEADTRLDRLSSRRGINISVHDYDADGHDEIVCSGNVFTAVFKPRRGGTLLHLALNRHNFDVTDTLTRRHEGYHLKLDQAVLPGSAQKTASIHDLVLAKEEGLKNFLVEDWYLKRCFIDHFFTADVDFDRFRSGRYGEEGDFIVEPFTPQIDSKSNTICLTREGHLWRPGGVIPVQITKQFTFQPGAEVFEARYEIKSLEGHHVAAKFAVENNFNFQGGHDKDRFILIDNRRYENSFHDSEGQYSQAGGYTVVDQSRNLAVALTSDIPCQIWHLPIFTVSLSEGGFEKVYQGTTFVNVYQLELSKRPVVINFSFAAG
ncbi:MAG: alpha-amylase/4-alpha-glucanotransferase domain-containing protein, partial [Candidatus Zixiibacteriota bacterium]